MVHVDTDMSTISKSNLTSFFRNSDVWEYMQKPEWLKFVKEHKNDDGDVVGVSLLLGEGHIEESGSAGMDANGNPLSSKVLGGDMNSILPPKSYVDNGLATKVDVSTYDTKIGIIDTGIDQLRADVDSIDTSNSLQDVGAPKWLVDNLVYSDANDPLAGGDLYIARPLNFKGEHPVRGLPDPTADSHATNKKWVEELVRGATVEASAEAESVKQAAVQEASALIASAEATLQRRDWSQIDNYPSHIDMLISDGDNLKLWNTINANGKEIKNLSTDPPKTLDTVVSKRYVDQQTNLLISKTQAGANIQAAVDSLDAKIAGLVDGGSDLRTAITGEINGLDTTTTWADMVAATDANGNYLHPPYLTENLLGMKTDSEGTNRLVLLGDIDFDSVHKIVNLTEPTEPSDAATKAYVDSMGMQSILAEALKQVRAIEDIKTIVVPDSNLETEFTPIPGAPKSYTVDLQLQTNEGARAAPEFELTDVDVQLTVTKIPKDIEGNLIKTAGAPIASVIVPLVNNTAEDGTFYEFIGNTSLIDLNYPEDPEDVEIVFSATPVAQLSRSADGGPITADSAIETFSFALQTTKVTSGVYYIHGIPVPNPTKWG